MEKNDKAAQNLEKVLLNFWERLSEVCYKKINVPEADVKCVSGVSSLLQVLQKPKSSLKSNAKRAGKVRFADEVPDGNDQNEKRVSSEGEHREVCALVAKPLPAPPDSDLISPRRKKPLENLVCRLAEMSINYVNEQKSEQHLRFLSTLLSSFSSTQVFKMLLGDEKPSIAKSKPLEIAKLIQRNPAVQFLYQRVVGWLNEDTRTEAGFVVDILYSALCCCKDEKERKDILDDLTEVLLLGIFFGGMVYPPVITAESSGSCQVVRGWLLRTSSVVTVTWEAVRQELGSKRVSAFTPCVTVGRARKFLFFSDHKVT